MPLPVLLVNGFVPFPYAMIPLQERFRSCGIDVSIVSFHAADVRSLERYAERVANAAHELLRRTRSPKINIVGYSAGAIVSMHAIKRLGLAQYVEKYVGLGGPFEGSQLSWAMLPTRTFSRIVMQLMPNSAYLYELISDESASSIPFLSIAGSKDLVCPPYTALLDSAERRILPASHLTLLTDLQVFRTTYRFLYEAL